MSTLQLSEVPLKVVSFAGVDVAVVGVEGTGVTCLPFSMRSCTTRQVDTSEEAASLRLCERDWRSFVRLTVSLDPACTEHWLILSHGDGENGARQTTLSFAVAAEALPKLEATLSAVEALGTSPRSAPAHVYLVSNDTRSRTGSFQSAPASACCTPSSLVSERVAIGDSAADIAKAICDVLQWRLVDQRGARQSTAVFWPACSCVPLCAHPSPDDVRRAEHAALRLPFTGLLHASQRVQTWGPPALQRSTEAPCAAGTAVRRGETWERELVRNPHEQMKKPPAEIAGAVTHITTGAYDYYHYRVDGFNDDGWGCAYRSLQTLLSWFQYEGLTSACMPSLRQIQEILSTIDPDKAGKKTFVGSKEWIGSFEIMLVLQHTLPGLECTIRRLESGGELDTNPEVQALLLSHFSAPRAAPVMIGGSAYAHTILGIHINQGTMEAQYLVLDPHYSSSTTVLKTVFNKQFLAWRRAPELFAKDHWYNMCLPRADSYNPR